MDVNSPSTDHGSNTRVRHVKMLELGHRPNTPQTHDRRAVIMTRCMGNSPRGKIQTHQGLAWRNRICVCPRDTRSLPRDPRPGAFNQLCTPLTLRTTDVQHQYRRPTSLHLSRSCQRTVHVRPTPPRARPARGQGKHGPGGSYTLSVLDCWRL
ncbi:hypothetical protein BD413DRAFT_231278 [Trametes elegans]|nr:hypothetical protein BD413DRAFT_231278 [Trametes elegans]